MGLYPIECPQCKKPFMWFSGSADQRCEDCMTKLKDEFIYDDINTRNCSVYQNEYTWPDLIQFSAAVFILLTMSIGIMGGLHHFAMMLGYFK